MSPRQKRRRRSKQRRRVAYLERSHNRRPGDAHTILSFCISNAISQSKYFDLKRKGKGPRELRIDGRVLISPQAENDWRAQREAETAEVRRIERESAA
jgi:hypothetical protein